MRVRRVAAGTLVAPLLAWAAASVAVYRRTFGRSHHPEHGEHGWTPEDVGVQGESLDLLTEDGLHLSGWYLPGTRSAAVVVSGGHRGHLADVLGISAALVRAGFHVVVYGARGTRGSDRAAHTLGAHERLDLRAAIDAIAGRVGDVPIGLLGYSLGGSVSITVAADDVRVRAVCSDSAFSDPLDVIGDGVQAVLRIPGAIFAASAVALLALRTGARLRDFQPLPAVAKIAPRPLFLIHGTDDRVVALRHAEALYAAAGEPKELWVLPGVGHAGAYFADRRRYVDRVTAFFTKALTT